MVHTLSATKAFLHIDRQLVSTPADTHSTKLAELDTVATARAFIHNRHGDHMAFVEYTIEVIVHPAPYAETCGVLATAQPADVRGIEGCQGMDTALFVEVCQPLLCLLYGEKCHAPKGFRPPFILIQTHAQ